MKLIDARVIFIDTNRNCLDAISTDGVSFLEDISYSKIGNKASGMEQIPEIGSLVVVKLSEDGQAEIYKNYQGRTRNDDSLVKFKNSLSDREKTSLPGDQGMTGPDGSFIKLLRGKVLQAGASPLCQTLYFGIENLIRTVCENYEAFGSGFRIYSHNVDGKIITRLCFTSLDTSIVNASIENTEAMSENFEYQIDITENNFVIFCGVLDPISKKRQNRIILELNPKDGISLKLGENISEDKQSTHLYAGFDGAISVELFDDNNKVIYNKSVATAGSGLSKVLVNEYINGDIVRLITGDLIEEIRGTHSAKITNQNIVAKIINKNSTLHRNTSGAFEDSINVSPSAKASTR